MDRLQIGEGARLTAKGTAEARRVIRRHRLMELFLTRVLGLDWSEVDVEAEALEHAISARLEQAIAEYLGEPGEDPHGHPIPTREGKLARRQLRPLHSFQSGETAVIREVQDDRPERLRRWSQLGLRPAAEVTVVSREPLDDTFRVRASAGASFVLGSEGLAGVLAEPCRLEAAGARQKSGEERAPRISRAAAIGSSTPFPAAIPARYWRPVANFAPACHPLALPRRRSAKTSTSPY